MAESTAPTARASHLSIGEVLALLLEEFPDVTISKIRFLESQGLVDPERTASGYRKFYDHDVELLRCILRQQREHYLPLKVIKDRLDSGELDPTNERPRPRGIMNVGDADVAQPQHHPSAGATRATGAAGLFERTDGIGPPDAVVAGPLPQDPAPQPSTSTTASPVERTTATPVGAVVPGLLLSGAELCAMAGLSPDQLAQLRTYGVVTGTSSRGDEPYDEHAVEIATIAKRFFDVGIEARHLRGWKVSVDREAGLFEQLVQPLLRQRNPEARAQALTELHELEALGGDLRAAMMRAALAHHGGH